MANDKKRNKDLSSKKTERTKLSGKESLKRMKEFPKRKGEFVAAFRSSLSSR